jgi:nucleoside-diphosphate-sugar epimerase
MQRSAWSSRNVLVTGGASFIGSHLTERLVAEGAAVRVVDDLSSGRREHLASCLGKIDFVEDDLRRPDVADAAMRDVDVVFHLAAAHGGRGYIDTHPVECSGNLVLDGTVLAAAHRARVDRVCLASSACVYPVTLQAPPRDGRIVYLREDMADPFRPGKAEPDGEYGWAKLMAEMHLRAYRRQYGMKGAICRLFTVYGERENETHAVMALIAKAFVGMDPYEIWGDGRQVRNFTYVGDTVEGLLRAAERIEDATPVNVGAPEHVTVMELVELIVDLVGWRPREFRFDTTRPVGVHSRAADVTRTRERLGWVPATPLREGVRRTVEWYQAVNDRAEVARSLGARLTER